MGSTDAVQVFQAGKHWSFSGCDPYTRVLYPPPFTHPKKRIFFFLGCANTARDWIFHHHFPTNRPVAFQWPVFGARVWAVLVTGVFLKQGGVPEFRGFLRDIWGIVGGNLEGIEKHFGGHLEESWRALRGD